MHFKISSSIFIIYFLKLCIGDDLSTFIELIEYDYEDQCAAIASTNKLLHTKDLTDLYNLYSIMSDKLEADESYAKFQREQAAELSSNDNDDVNTNRKMQLLTKVGDSLLPESDISKILDLKDTTEKMLLTSSINCFNDSNQFCNIYYEDILKTLATSTDANELEYVWSAWNTKFEKHDTKLIENIKLLQKSAEVNDVSDVEAYWDLLTEYTNSFRRMKTIWEEIEPLYLKLHKFVRDRLVYYEYMSEDSEEIPIYLLGSAHGENWINLADKILPDPQIYDKLLRSIQEKTIGGKNAFICAQLLANNVGLQDFNEQFWKNSVFDAKCPTNLLNFCQNGNIEVITCNSTSLLNFIEANGIGFHVAQSELMGAEENNLSFIMRNPNRQSAIQEAVKEIGRLLSIHPSNLHTQDLIYLHEYDIYSEKYQAKHTLLLLNALRILPKLAYYVSADEWKLQVIQNDTSDINWWDLRQQYQRVTGNGNVSDYLYDLDMLENKPFIGKFLGTVMQFQVIEYFKRENEDENQDIIEKIKENSNFRDLLKSGYSEEWPYLTDRYLNIEEVDPSALLTYFQPLVDYLENAPLKRNTLKPVEITTTTTPLPTTTVTTTEEVGNPDPVVETQTANLKESAAVENSTENNDSVLLSKSNIYIIIGSSILLICAIIGGVAIFRSRTKQDKTEVRNNRRFEA